MEENVNFSSFDQKLGEKEKHPEIHFLSNVTVTPCSRPPFYLIGSPSPLRALSGWGVSCVAQTFAPLLKEGDGKKKNRFIIQVVG